MLPKIIQGNAHQDNRGSLKYNNNFNLSQVKRMYVIENADIELKRGWQGHKIEQRWFTAVSGSFQLKLIVPNDWFNPTFELEIIDFTIESKYLDILHVPQGYLSAIKALEENSKLLVMTDYALGEVKDEYKFPIEQFNCYKEFR